MSATTSTPAGLSFPRATFAQLAPNRFLQAHLSERPAKRPNGRHPDELRRPVINSGSLSHSNGSAVVRLGDTAVVCGVRAEILLASDIPNPPKGVETDQLEQLGLVVPNLELSTGCSQAHLPGNPPSSLAQSLSWRLYSLLHTSGIIDIENLRIAHIPPINDAEEQADPVTKAYWTLYVDILCISLDGACLDAAWTAVLAALRDTKLPRAYWDADREIILCSPHSSQAALLRLKSLPIPTTFAVFSTASPLKQSSEAESWLLADPDTSEEEASKETVTITTDGDNILRIEKSGGSSINMAALRHCVELAKSRSQQLRQLLDVR